jgi:hypothetical protein
MTSKPDDKKTPPKDVTVTVTAPAPATGKGGY